MGRAGWGRRFQAGPGLWRVRAGVLLLAGWFGVGFGQSAPVNSGTGLRFNGVSSFVRVPHEPALNAYPMTITAWVRTSREADTYDGIASKYSPPGADGYSLFLRQGRLRAWYYHNPTKFINDTGPGADGDGLNGGFIADGFWHHVAFVVSPVEGVLYVDGQRRQSLPWQGVGNPGPPTTNGLPLLLGRLDSQISALPSLNSSWLGDMDEVTLWSRALGEEELNHLKHRRLGGREDGLLAYWRCNDGAGLAVTNAVGPNFQGTWVNGAVWVASQAAVPLQPVATNALRLAGTGDYVSVPSAADLNSFPLTVTAWVRTQTIWGGVDGIVSKYLNGQFDGYSLYVVNGQLRGWFFGGSTENRVFPEGDDYGLLGGFIADGEWHHVAMVVDGSGGRLVVDGNAGPAAAWIGTPAAPTTGEPLQIGRYVNALSSFSGQIDEVTVWNRAFTDAELQASMHLSRRGDEAALVAYWRLDEGVQLAARDATGRGHTGTLRDGAGWVGSTAPLGDGNAYWALSPGTPSFASTRAIRGSPQRSFFEMPVETALRRFYDYGTPPPPTDVAVQFGVGLRVAGAGTAIGLATNIFVSQPVRMTAYPAAAPQPMAGGNVVVGTLVRVEPATGIQLDSVNRLYEAVVTNSYVLAGEPAVAVATESTAATRLFHFNGTMWCGPIETRLTDIYNEPTVEALAPPSFLRASVGIPPGGGRMAAQPALTFGGGLPIAVALATNGTATNLNGSFTVSVPQDARLTVAGIQYRPDLVTLNAQGLTVGTVEVWLPAGFGFQLDSTGDNRPVSRLLYSRLRKGLSGAESVWDNAIRPPVDLTFLPQDIRLDAAGFRFAEETKPFWMLAPSLAWRIDAGELRLQPSALEPVRRREDHALWAAFESVTDPLATKRISNDGYFTNIVAEPGQAAVIRADANGAALLSLRAALGPADYRPHFPYLGPAADPIRLGPGVLVISNDLIDTAASFVTVSGPVPVSYDRDCDDAGGCGRGLNGPATLWFTPTNSARPMSLRFTVDGGLFALGTNPPAQLEWGSVDGAKDAYAQRTSEVSAGAYHVPGTFLRGDQTAVTEATLPAVILYTGWGAATNSSYAERPETPGYEVGAANYAGLNFWAPARGRSRIGDQDTGWYALRPRAKYYVRHGGVSGLHETENFTTNLTVYGYPIRFLSYRLSFLDNMNWESRTDGSLELPFPSQFGLEFERLKFTCSGALGPARLRGGPGEKTLAYWNTKFRPLSLAFRPAASDPCSRSNRFLVVGVEAQVPSISQPIVGSLGFRPTGHLTTLADRVEGSDSRLPVPARLELAGPEGRNYTIRTAGYGYFNAYAKEEPGFFNILGGVKVPFFEDIKVHLHVTPLGLAGSGGASVELAGGWTTPTGSSFTQRDFDAEHLGWPAGVNIKDYRRNLEGYRPRARQNWLEAAVFDYPLRWDPVLRQFSSFAPHKVILPVLDVDSRLKELTPTTIDLDFAQDLELNLPRIEVMNVLQDGLDKVTSPVRSLQTVISNELKAVLPLQAFRGLQRFLKDTAEDTFRPMLEPALTPVVDNLYAPLSAALAKSRTELLDTAAQIVAASSNHLKEAVSGVIGSAGDADTVVHDLDETLGAVEETLDLLVRMLEKRVVEANPAEGKPREEHRQILRVLVQKVAGDQVKIPNAINDTVVDHLLSELEPTMDKIESALKRVHGEFKEARAQIAGFTGDFGAALKAVGRNSDLLDGVVAIAGRSVSNFLFSATGYAGDEFAGDPARMKQALREELIASFLSAPLTANYQRTFREFLYDKDFAVNQIMEVLFDQINQTIRKAYSAVGNDSTFLALKDPQLGQDPLLAAHIVGTPRFVGDSLRQIHLDSDIQMNIPDPANPLKFRATLDVHQRNAESGPVACVPAGESRAEVILRANRVPLTWVGVSKAEGAMSDLTLTLEGRWTLQRGEVKGIGGSVAIEGKGGFKACDASGIEAALAIGDVENYFAGQAEATVRIGTLPVKFRAGIFVGHACSLEPLKLVDPKVEEVLRTPVMSPEQFSGIYLEFGGGVSLSDALPLLRDIDPRCLIELAADISTVVYYNGGPRYNRVGGRQTIGLDAKLLCVLSGRAEWSAFFALDGLERLTVGGSVYVEGGVNLGLFEVKDGVRLTLTGVVDEGGIDYYVDY